MAADRRPAGCGDAASLQRRVKFRWRRHYSGLNCIVLACIIAYCPADFLAARSDFAHTRRHEMPC
jgi:hypothetical protein